MYKSILFISCVLMLSCSDFSGEGSEPLGISGHVCRSNLEGICRENMLSISAACDMYYGQNNAYPDSIGDLCDILPVDKMFCPANGDYDYWADEATYFIACSSEHVMSHGFIDDGTPSWPPDPWEHEDICQSNLMVIASACAMYYGWYNTYPENLGDLEDYLSPGTICCPLNGAYTYWGDDETYFLACPSEHGMSHGFIEDGIPSWTD